MQIPGTTWSDQVYGAKNCGGCIKTDGTLWSWGLNQTGLLGHNNRTTYSSPKQVGTDTTWKYLCKGSAWSQSMMAIKTNGTLWAWGLQQGSGCLGLNEGSTERYSSPTQVGTDTTWHGVSMSNSDNKASCMALKVDGTLWSWGDNSEGQLGVNSKTSQSSPTQIGTETTWGNGVYNFTNGGDYTFTLGALQGSAVKTDGTLWSWGKNGEGNLGHNNRSDYSSPRQVGTDTNWGGVAGGGQNGEKQVHYFFEKAKG